MSKGSGGQAPDNSLSYIVALVVLIFVGYWAFDKYQWAILIPWKWLRVTELALTGQFDMVMKIINFNFTEFGIHYEYVNQRVYIAFRILTVFVILHAVYYFRMNAKPGWSMEEYLYSIYNRFAWLAVVYDPPKGLSLKKSFPFIAFEFAHKYTDVEFPEGVEPLTYLATFEAVLPEKLKGQIGPALTIKNKQVVWADKYAKEVALECFKRIPDKRPSPDAKSWREQAWQRCVATHRFERTFALGMMQAARDFGVMNAAEMLHIRRSAGMELQSKNDGAFHLWRAMISLGGRAVYAEGAGIVCHYHFEKALTDYLVTHPDDGQIVHFMRGKPWVVNALNSFTEVRDIVMNSPDVIALQKAGLLKR